MLPLLAAATWPALAQQVDGWSQFQGGAAHPGTVEGAPEPPYEAAWSFRAADRTLSGAVLAGDVVVTVGRTAVYGLDVETGEVRWRLSRNDAPLSMPAVGRAGSRDVLVFTDPSPSGPALVGVDLADRNELWRTDLEASSRSGVAISDGLAFTADDEGTVYALDLLTGEARWTATTIGEVLVPPAVADGNVYVVGREQEGQSAQLAAFDVRTGEATWRFDAPAAGSAASGPAAGDGFVVVGFADRTVRAFDANDGTERWSALALTLFSPAGAPATLPEGVYVADVAGGVYRLDPRNGGRRWDHQPNDLVIRSSPVVAGDAVLVGLNDGRFLAFDTATGDLIWQDRLGPGLVGAISMSADVVVTVKGGSRPGLVAYRHDPDGELVRVASPTRIDPVRLLGNYAIALAVTFVALFVPFRFLATALRRREGSVEEPQT